MCSCLSNHQNKAYLHILIKNLSHIFPFLHHSFELQILYGNKWHVGHNCGLLGVALRLVGTGCTTELSIDTHRKDRKPIHSSQSHIILSHPDISLSSSSSVKILSLDTVHFPSLNDVAVEISVCHCPVILLPCNQSIIRFRDIRCMHASIGKTEIDMFMVGQLP
jgi:hypothetical protein